MSTINNSVKFWGFRNLEAIYRMKQSEVKLDIVKQYFQLEKCVRKIMTIDDYVPTQS